MQNISFSLDVEGKKQQKEDMLNNERSRLLFSVEHKKACRMIRIKIKSNEPKEVLGIDIIKVFTSCNNPKGNANTERYFNTTKNDNQSLTYQLIAKTQIPTNIVTGNIKSQ